MELASGRRRAPCYSHGAAVNRPLNQVSDGSGKQKAKKIKDQQNQQPSELERERLSEPCEAGVGVEGQEEQDGERWKRAGLELGLRSFSCWPICRLGPSAPDLPNGGHHLEKGPETSRHLKLGASQPKSSQAFSPPE